MNDCKRRARGSGACLPASLLRVVVDFNHIGEPLNYLRRRHTSNQMLLLLLRVRTQSTASAIVHTHNLRAGWSSTAAAAAACVSRRH